MLLDVFAGLIDEIVIVLGVGADGLSEDVVASTTGQQVPIFVPLVVVVTTAFWKVTVDAAIPLPSALRAVGADVFANAGLAQVVTVFRNRPRSLQRTGFETFVSPATPVSTPG